MFNVGDKVRTTIDSEPGELRSRIGTVGEVLDTNMSYPYKVDFGQEYDWYSADELEAVEEDRQHFEGGGMREPQGDRPRFDLLIPEGVPYDEQFLTRFAVHMAKGGQKYADRNWEQFADQEALDRAKASALRHIVQWMTNADDGEDHASAVVFNLMAAENIKRKLS